LNSVAQLQGCGGSVGDMVALFRDVVAQLVGMWWLSWDVVAQHRDVVAQLGDLVAQLRDVVAQFWMWWLSLGCGGSVGGCGDSVWDVVAQLGDVVAQLRVVVAQLMKHIQHTEHRTSIHNLYSMPSTIFLLYIRTGSVKRNETTEKQRD
jgi:hypothetical protein